MARRLVGILAALGFVLAAAGVQAQNYDPLREETNRTQELIEELTTLIDAAERSRAADRRFVRDLRSVLRRFDNPWQVRLITEDFRDGNFQSNPAWTVESGDFFVTRRGGLHSEAVASLALRRSGATGSGGGGDSSRDLVVGILAEILRSTQSAPDERAEPAQRRNRAAVIYLRTPISNAFAVTAEISAPDPAGALELAVYQGAGREIGYRLVFLAEGGIELLREGRRRSSVIDFVDDTPALGGGVTHLIEWTRTQDGQTVVRLDGTTVIKIRDRSFRDPFDGFQFVNRGGEYVLRSLTIDGTN
ncbi:MAG: hypothetical protein IID55_12120 [Proteobacteria bacterium]|nr:hypothetical protein [Pseudomonadota bacterium]